MTTDNNNITSDHSPADARAAGRSARQSLSKAHRRLFSDQLCRKLVAHHWYRRARCVAVYVADGAETNMAGLINFAWQDDKQVVVPVVQNKHAMQFTRIDPYTQWQRNRFGLLEPRRRERFATTQIRSKDIDLFCVPLTAFDAQFNRSGMSGGYYDRYFAHHALAHLSRRIGVGFSVQQVTSIAINEWDVAMHGIATEHGVATTPHRRT